MKTIKVDKNYALNEFPEITFEQLEGIQVLGVEEDPLENASGTMFDDYKKWKATLRMVYNKEPAFTTLVEYDGTVEMIILAFKDEDSKEEVGRFFGTKGYLQMS
jgi:hypothetical protein